MSPAILVALLAATAGFFFAFVCRERRETYPLIDFSLFRNRTAHRGDRGRTGDGPPPAPTCSSPSACSLSWDYFPAPGLIVTAFAAGSLPVGVPAGGLLHRTGVRPLIGGGLSWTPSASWSPCC